MQKWKTNKQCSLRFHLASPASPPASSAFRSPAPHSPVFPYRLTQHPQSLLARLVPRGQGGMVDDAGDVGVVVAAGHLQGELAAHRVRGIVFNGLHHVWASWRGEWARRNGRGGRSIGGHIQGQKQHYTPDVNQGRRKRFPYCN